VPRPRTFDEADVVARARQAFAETGFAGTSLDALLEATGLARQSLYNAFGGKRELFMRAFLSDTAEAVDAVEIVRHGSEHPIARIRTQLVHVAVTHGSAQAAPSLFTKAAVELGAHDPQVASTVAAAFDTMREHYAACIVEAQAA
jgi:AcrR family transcriptional regulator